MSQVFLIFSSKKDTVNGKNGIWYKVPYLTEEHWQEFVEGDVLNDGGHGSSCF